MKIQNINNYFLRHQNLNVQKNNYLAFGRRSLETDVFSKVTPEMLEDYAPTCKSKKEILKSDTEIKDKLSQCTEDFNDFVANYTQIGYECMGKEKSDLPPHIHIQTDKDFRKSAQQFTVDKIESMLIKENGVISRIVFKNNQPKEIFHNVKRNGGSFTAETYYKDNGHSVDCVYGAICENNKNGMPALVKADEMLTFSKHNGKTTILEHFKRPKFNSNNQITTAEEKMEYDASNNLTRYKQGVNEVFDTYDFEVKF